MRPNLLEVSGFTAFREPVIVDFRGADLFALTGPTGSGKSSLIDAMVFSLYGSVPRLGQRDVAPVVSLGKLEARVRFEFSLGGTDYTVARVVRRTKGGGATTAEARLESGDGVLAGTADEVTEKVGELLGLGFEHFTKSVVLPQGQFAAFLHDRPADRQKLLRELLDLGVYERMRELAKHRRVAAQAETAIRQTQLDELAFATESAEEQAAERLLRLQNLQEAVEASEPQLQALRDRIETLTESTARADDSVVKLKSIKTPAGIGVLAARLDEARRAKVEAAAQETSMVALLDETEETRRSLPERAFTEGIVKSRRAYATEQQAAADLRAELTTIEQEAQAANGALEEAGLQLVEARTALEAINRSHAAHALTSTLVAGEACPVCHQTVQDPPNGRPPPALTEGESAVEKAARAEEAARQLATKSGQRLATERARLEDLEARIAALEKDLADAPSLDEASKTIEEISAVESSLKEARQESDRAAKVSLESRRALDTIDAEMVDARREFDRSRDGVAALEPPVAERTDLAADWALLNGWATEAVSRLEEESATSKKLIEDAKADLKKKADVLTSRLQDEGLEVAGRPLRDTVVAACTAAGHELSRIREAAQRAAELDIAIAAGGLEADLAKSLGRHLAANGFEAWLMEEALATLVGGANLLLGDLADGAYSLEVVKRDFRVIDHRNANEPRLVKTLSGGETFLVSLALALSLAEQLASMSVHGGGRLESVFLDEGFGTLDSETLDTVAHVIQELGAQGRTVGIVTHVRDLAEQVPVRFEVRKGGGTSTVERVEL